MACPPSPHLTCEQGAHKAGAPFLWGPCFVRTPSSAPGSSVDERGPHASPYPALLAPPPPTSLPARRGVRPGETQVSGGRKRNVPLLFTSPLLNRTGQQARDTEAQARGPTPRPLRPAHKRGYAPLPSYGSAHAGSAAGTPPSFCVRAHAEIPPPSTCPPAHPMGPRRTQGQGCERRAHR